MGIIKKSSIVAGIVLGRVIYYLSYFIARKENMWAFGSFGVYNDNSRYLYEYCQAQGDIRAIWISKNRDSVEQARKYGEAYYYYSVKGIYYALKSSVYIYSSYLSDINFYTSNKTLKVNLWHGVPLKKIEFDINSPPLVFKFKHASKLYQFTHPSQHTTPDLLLSPSHYVTNYSFKSAFKITDNSIIHAMYPRVAKLIQCEPLSELSVYNKIFLYAPTWRDGGEDFLMESGINFELIDKVLKKNNSMLLIKLHPSTKLTLEVNLSNVKIVDNQIDPIALMKSSHCLITDYSSIYFDYLYLNRPIIFFPFDKDKYLENREMYFSYEDVAPGDIVTGQEELIQAICDIINNKDKSLKKRIECFNSFELETSGNGYIVQKIKGKYQEWRY